MQLITDYKAYLRDLFVRAAVTPKDMITSCKAVLGSLPIVANALVQSLGKKVKIKHGSTLGATDGKTIYLMDMPIPSNSTDVDTFVLMLALSYGLIHHEVGHVNHSTFPIPKEVGQDPLLGHLFGIIEDVRQENLHIDRYPGAKPYLDGLNAALQITGHWGPIRPADPPIQVLTGYLLYRLYMEYRNDYTVSNLVSQAEDAMKTAFPPGVLVRLETILPRMDDLESSDDALQLARDIKVMLKDEVDKARKDAEAQAAQAQQNNAQQASQPPSTTPGDAANPSPSQATDAPADPAQATPAPTGDTPESGGQPSTPDTSDGSDQGASASPSASDTPDGSDQGASASPSASDIPDGSDQGASASPSQDGPDSATQQRITNLQEALDGQGGGSGAGYGDRSQVVADALNALVGEVRQQGSQGEVMMTGAHLDTDVASATGNLETSTAPYDMSAALSVTGQLRMKLVREMQALIEGDTNVGVRGRRLSGKHLARIGVGDGRVFKTRDEDIDVNTAVCLALDVSGSMKGPEIEIASQALYATTKALEGIDGVNVAATTFPGYHVIKPFGVKSRMVEDRFHLAAHGGTPMAEGIVMAQRMLAATPEDRKVLIVITDGGPNSYAATELAILAASAVDIEVYGLGICSEAGAQLFANWQSIREISDLPFTLINLLRERVLPKAA